MTKTDYNKIRTAHINYILCAKTCTKMAKWKNTDIRKVLDVFPLQEINCGCTGQSGRNAYKEWIDLAFRYKVLHVTPLRVVEGGGNKQKDAGIPKPYEAGRINLARKRMNRRTRRRRRYDTASKSNKTTAILCYRNPL